MMEKNYKFAKLIIYIICIRPYLCLYSHHFSATVQSGLLQAFLSFWITFREFRTLYLNYGRRLSLLLDMVSGKRTIYSRRLNKGLRSKFPEVYSGRQKPEEGDSKQQSKRFNIKRTSIWTSMMNCSWNINMASYPKMNKRNYKE